MAPTVTQPPPMYNLVLQQPAPRKLFKSLDCKISTKFDEVLFVMDEDFYEEEEQDCLASATMELHEILQNPCPSTPRHNRN